MHKCTWNLSFNSYFFNVIAVKSVLVTILNQISCSNQKHFCQVPNNRQNVATIIDLVINSKAYYQQPVHCDWTNYV